MSEEAEVVGLDMLSLKEIRSREASDEAGIVNICTGG